MFGASALSVRKGFSHGMKIVITALADFFQACRVFVYADRIFFRITLIKGRRRQMPRTWSLPRQNRYFAVGNYP
jgi:TRAP-type C4-dicarboxylate transport system permease small subunit